MPGNPVQLWKGEAVTLLVNTNLSALMAFGKKMGVHANNIANMYSEGFRKSRALLKEGRGQTTVVEIKRLESSNPPSSRASESRVQNAVANNVNVASEIVGAMTSQRGYEANSASVKTEEEMTGTILDLVG